VDRDAGRGQAEGDRCLVQQPMAFRKNLTGMALAPVQFFWTMEEKKG
jgi:hypothetical protein